MAVLPLVACKPKASSDAPDRDVRSWTVAEIEAELDRNHRVLADEGVMIAMASPAAEPADPATTPAPEVEPPAGEGYRDIDPEDAGQPEPPMAAAPHLTTMPEPSEAEPNADVSRSRSSPGQRREGRRSRMASRSPRRDAGSRCERVCELASATCDLETQICKLAERHPDEPRYAQACLRAEQQCVAASQACERCEE